MFYLSIIFLLFIYKIEFNNSANHYYKEIHKINNIK